ncbi:hypothetical protein BUALT_Bualt01G0113300 [Buddleja alternifolia]|uniref:Uncharacterized protein n=1 Tax=Buddleja alternifolia TaxID=168488 RepID=A0AAV6YAC8_9LAMI|nr:hypothetical protein BUALT_Bualt01G0113300 [Buddleja alternifolia]
MTSSGGNQQLFADPVPFARSYQLEALEKALKQNTVVFFETGTGKTLIEIMLLRSYAHLLKKPSPNVAVFLVPTVVLVTQQGKAVTLHTDLKVGKYYGELGVDYWDAASWKQEKDKHEEFYHRELASNNLQLPRVFGMTASPIKAKALGSDAAYWKRISELENLMNSKHELSLSGSSISKTLAKSAKEKLNKLSSTLMFCISELGVWLAMKAAEFYTREQEAICTWVRMDISGERVVRAFSTEAIKLFSAFMPSGPQWSIHYNLTDNMTAGYLTSKVMCLVETLLEYREMNDLRCIVFVERIVTAVAIRSLLNELPEFSGWKTEYTAGNNSQLQSQSRKEQNAIIEEFRKGTVNIIVATSMLEEGLDVQSCNLVIRFDPSATICSFIQSRGRARMQNSDFVLMVKSDDCSACARVDNYLASGNIMRRECLSHADIPCEPLENEMYGEAWYKVESTGAIVTLRSSVQLLYFYCSRLPSDGSCPIQKITVHANPKFLRQEACLEACMKLHQDGALTDNLVPDMVEEEAEAQEFECTGSKAYLDEHAKYIPPELVSSSKHESETLHHLYSIDMLPDFQYDVKFRDVMLAIHTKLENDLNLDLDVDRWKLVVRVKYIGHITLTSKRVALCQRFQATLFRVLLHHNLNELQEDLHQNAEEKGFAAFDYLLLPSVWSNENVLIDWKCILAVLYTNNASGHTDCFSSRGLRHYVQTKNGLVCHCMLENSLVCTPHNGFLYCIAGTLDGFDDFGSNHNEEMPRENSFGISGALGDSFLKYAASQQLFKTYQNRHEGLLSLKRERIISNATLCKLGCDRKITGFIRNEPFDPKTWIIPGTNCANSMLEEETPSSKKVYCGGKRKIKMKTVADVTEALIGAFLSAGGEIAALSFMSWLGITVDFVSIPYTRNVAVNPELHVDIKCLESLLNYKFQDVTLLVEALTHGSYMLPEIPGCYQRLEFLGDAVLDYCITMHLHHKYPGLSPGLLTDLRSASVNNDCYAQSTIKVLGDVIESLGGAILVDSGYNKDTVFQSMRPLLEPLVTPAMLRLHPIRELTELC